MDLVHTLKELAKDEPLSRYGRWGDNKPMWKLYGDIRRSEVRLKKLVVNYIVNRKK